jgi:4-hydroxy-tetrahydrodipicolinate synthase
VRGTASFGEVVTAIVTPFRDDLSVDLDGFATLCDRVLASGSDAVVVAGTTGEAPTLEDEEKIELFFAAREAAPNKVVLAGTGSCSTAHAVNLSERAVATGVDGLLVVVPYYNRPPARGIVNHFRSVAASTDLPIMVYNIPKRTAVALDRDTILELSEIPNLNAIKQADPDLDLARFIVDETSLELYAGNDDLVIPFTQIGGAGGVFVYTHLVGQAVKEIVTLVKTNEIDTAERAYSAVLPALEAVEAAPNPIAVKAALESLGHISGEVRPPLARATREEVEKIERCLDRAGLFAPGVQGEVNVEAVAASETGRPPKREA